MRNRKMSPVGGKVTILYIAGVEGNSLYINNFRVAGPKPWGGGKVLKEWKNIDIKDILEAIGKKEKRG